jgi:hypothetical protein
MNLNVWFSRDVLGSESGEPLIGHCWRDFWIAKPVRANMEPRQQHAEENKFAGSTIVGCMP